MKRVIPGCQHEQVRMIEWATEGACPICLTASLGMANDRIAALEKVREAAEFRVRNGCDDSCNRDNPCTCGNVALRAALHDSEEG